MKTLPSLIIVADRGHMTAYQCQTTGALKAIESMDIAEGLQKISDLVTDQAGRFPSGSQGYRTSSAESLPLEAELEVRTFRKIAHRIEQLCVATQPDTWAFAAPSEINGAILDMVDQEWRDHLVINLRLDLTGVPANQLTAHFTKARQKRQYLAEA